MRTKNFVLAVLVFFSGTALGDRILEKSEIMQIFENLTSLPQKTWIPSGTIYASHEEYRAPKITNPDEITYRINQKVQAYLESPTKPEPTERLQQKKLEAIPFNTRYRLSNEYTMNSNVIVKFDGTRFYWEIEVDTRLDSIKPPTELIDNYFTREFNLNWNQRRVFAWDGEKYTMYFRPGNHAIITDIPSGINGPLTAGLIPWGYAQYSINSLSSAKSSAIEVTSNEQPEIQLKVINGSNEEMFILDPTKKYAVKFYSLNVENTSMTVCNYSNYHLVGDNWCPDNIIIEKYDITTNPPRVMARDIWNFIAINKDIPGQESFNVEYDYDALVEDYRFDSSPLQFRYSSPLEPSARNIDLDELLQKRLENTYLSNSEEQNCATVSLKYVCTKLGLNQPWEKYSQLIHSERKITNMFEMKQFLRNLGLHSLAVKTDLGALRELDDGWIILHLPVKNHYVVLANIDDEYVRLIDLDQNNFYYRNTIEYFESIWDNVALVVNKGPILMKGNFAKINDSLLVDIMGAANCQSCTDKIQESRDFPCDSSGGDCGSHDIVYERWSCESAASGSCFESGMIGSESENCEEDSESFDCVGEGDWTSYYIQACN